MSAHLGALVSALVDDQLPHAAREKALVHLATCDRCAEEVRDTKVARGIVNSAGGTPALRSDFIDGLLHLAADQAPVPEPTRAGSSDSPFIPHSPVPGGAWCGVLPKRRKTLLFAKYGAAFLLGGACAAAFILGARPNIAPKTDQLTVAQRLNLLHNSTDFTPLHEVSAVHADGSRSGVDFTKLNDWLTAHGWTAPHSLPQGVSISEVGFLSQQPNELEMIVDTPIGEVLIVESQGVLDLSNVTVVQEINRDLGSVYVIGKDPTHLVWQSGDTVIELLSPRSAEELADFAHTFEAQQHDSGISARLVRGFTDLAGVVSE